jgi:hypothetical protein
LYDEEKNPYGYKLMVLCYCLAEECDEKEQLYIRQYADDGWQLKNVEIGGKSGKTDMNERKPSKGYREGLINGRKKALKEVAKFFEKNLTYQMREPINKTKQNALKKFESMLAEVDESNSESEDG